MGLRIKDKGNLLQKPLIIAVIALFCCLLWGSAFVFIKLGYEFFQIQEGDIFSKLIFAGIRFISSSIIVLTVCLISGNNININKSQFKSVGILGLIQTFLQYSFLYIGMANVTGTNGSILTSSAPFFTIILAHFFYKRDRLNKRKFIGISLGFLGIVALNLGGIGGFKLIGEGFVIMASLLAAIASIYIKKISDKVPIFALSFYQLLIGGLMLVSIGLIGTGGELLDFNLKGNLILLYLSFVSAIGFSLWSTLLKYNNVSRVSVYKFSPPLFGVLLSFFILGERYLSPMLIVSIFLVSAGIIIINIENK